MKWDVTETVTYTNDVGTPACMKVYASTLHKLKGYRSLMLLTVSSLSQPMKPVNVHT